MTGQGRDGFSVAFSPAEAHDVSAAMTFDEIQREVVALSEEERLRLSVFLKHLARVDTEENKAELARLNAEIDAGKYYTMEDLEKADADLLAEGR